MFPSTRLQQVAGISAATALLSGVLGIVLWATGRPFLFPSLGPTAFALAFQPGQHQARDVLGGHLCGVLGGLIAYTAIADGTVLTALPPAQSEAAARMAGSGVLSVGLTTAGMLGTRAVHAPACATTLIVSLGLLPTLQDGALIVASVTVLYGVDAGGRAIARTYRRSAHGIPDDDSRS